MEEITRLAALGEGPNLEFKTRSPKPERLAKELIAFANTSGGRMLLGVEDDGSVVGLKDVVEEQFALQEALKAHCDPPLRIIVEDVPISKKRSVLVVEVPESTSKPHFLVIENGQVTRTAYVRVEDKSVEASRESVRLMRSEKSTRNVLFEFGDIEQVLMRYLDNYGRITVAQFARLANISPKRASHKLVLLTKANVLQLHTDVKADYFTLA